MGLVSLDELKDHHIRLKKTLLEEFTNGPRIKVPEHEQLTLMELVEKIDDKYPWYKKRAYEHVSNCLRMMTCTAHFHIYCHKIYTTRVKVQVDCGS